MTKSNEFLFAFTLLRMNLPWERNGSAATPSNHLRSDRGLLLPRVASSGTPCINWQGSWRGGRDEVNHETSLTDCPGRGHICCGNGGGHAACTQRGGTEPLRPAKNGAARGGVQIQRQCLELRPGKGHQRDQGYGWKDSRHQERLVENIAEPNQRFQRRLCYRIHKRRSRCRLRRKPDP